MTLAAIYCRVSTDEQSDFSLQGQEDACRAACQERGWSVQGVYADEGWSGSRESRPALDRMVAQLGRSSPFAIVLVHDLSRLARSVRVPENLLYTFARHKIRVIAVKERFDSLDLTTRMMSQFSAVMNEQFLEMLRFHVKKGLRTKAQNGLWVGGVPYGYRAVDKDTIVPNEATAPVIKLAYELYATGRYSLAQLADELNGRGIGKHFGVESLRDVIKNPAYVGDVLCAKQRYPGKHEALIDIELWQRCQEVRAARGGGRPARRAIAGSAARCRRLLPLWTDGLAT